LIILAILDGFERTISSKTWLFWRF